MVDRPTCILGGLNDLFVMPSRDRTTSEPVTNGGFTFTDRASKGGHAAPDGDEAIACHAVQNGLQTRASQSLLHQIGRYEGEMEPNDRLRTARERAGFESAADAARRFGWQIVTYRHHENGTRGIKQPAAIRYARAFRVSPEWILFGAGGPEKKSVPLVGYVGAGAEVVCTDDGYSGLDEVDPPPGVGPEAVAVVVRGDSMWPRYFDGDVIIYDSHTSLEKVNGRECIVALSDGRRYIKNIRRNSDGTYDLESWNAPPIRSVNIEWVAEVVWVKRA